MTNYREVIINELNKLLEDAKSMEDFKSDDAIIQIEVIEFVIKYINNYFYDNFKRYNHNEDRAYDKFSANKALEYLNAYVELIQPIKCDKKRQKYLRNIIHILYKLIR